MFIKKLILLVLCVSLIPMICLSVNADFSDVSTQHWAYDEINTLFSKGIVNGMGDGKFAPDLPVSREQFVKLLVLSVGIDVFDMKYFEDNRSRYSQICHFYDMEETALYEQGNYIFERRWSEPYVYTAVMNSIIKYSDYTPQYYPDEQHDGYSGEDRFYFYPAEPISRGEAARYIARALSLRVNASIDFGDMDDVIYKNEVISVVQAGILKGFEDNTFRPKSNTTRAEAAVIISRILDYTEKNPIIKNKFDKVICEINYIDFESPDIMTLYADEVQPCLVSKAEWDAYWTGDQYTFMGTTYYIWKDWLEDCLLTEPGEPDGSYSPIGIGEFDETHYVFIMLVSYGPMFYEKTGNQYVYALSDDFCYFSEDQEAGQRWFKYYSKQDCISKGLPDGRVTLQIVNGKVLFAYDA